jgi:hypothetical protein
MFYKFTNILFGNLNIKKLEYKNLFGSTSKQNSFNKIVIHHSKNVISLSKIYELHVLKKKWFKIGYHFVIDNKGLIYQTRELYEVGAHVFGFNFNSIGICLIGNFNIDEPTDLQVKSLKNLIIELKNINNDSFEIFGHIELSFLRIFNIYKISNEDKINLLDFKSILKYKDYLNFLIKKYNISKQDTKYLTSCPGINCYNCVKGFKKENF